MVYTAFIEVDEDIIRSADETEDTIKNIIGIVDCIIINSSRII